MAKRVKIGDVIEITTAEGLVYAQCSHKNKEWGHLLRILPGFHEERPCDYSILVKLKESFVVFFPLQAAVSKGIFQIVANEEVPPEAQKFPLFRAAGYSDKQGYVHDWWLWDGEKEWQIGRLTEELKKLPIRQIINDTLLIEWIETGWTPSTDPITIKSCCYLDRR